MYRQSTEWYQVCVASFKLRYHIFNASGAKIGVMFSNISLTLQTISIEKVLALLVAFDSTLGTAHALASNTPQQSLTLVAVSRCGGCPHLEIVWGGAGDGIYEGLEGLLVDMTLLQGCSREKCRVRLTFGMMQNTLD